MPPVAVTPTDLIPTRRRRVVDLIVVHCSATPSGHPLDGPASVVINRWHRDRNPPFARSPGARARWNPELGSIGYHAVIDLQGDLFPGRHWDEVGAHAVGHNRNSLGVCVVGGLERQARYTQAQWDTLASLVRAWSRRCAPGWRVLGHRDLAADANGDGRVDGKDWLKTCPGFDVPVWTQRAMVPLNEHICTAPGEAS